MRRTMMVMTLAALAVGSGCAWPPDDFRASLTLGRVPSASEPEDLRALRIGPRLDDNVRPALPSAAKGPLPGNAAASPRPSAGPAKLPSAPLPSPSPLGATGQPTAGPSLGQVVGRVALVTTGRPARVVLYDAATGAALATGPEQAWAGPGQPRISADGRWLTYVGADARGDKGVVLWDVVSRRAIGLGAMSRDERRDPDVSGNGHRLIYLLGGVRAQQLALYDVASGAQTTLAVDRELALTARTPTLSGDGQTCAFVTTSARGDANIMVIDLASGRPIAPPTLNTPDQELDPALSQDGRVLVFSSDRNGTFDLYAYDLSQARYLSLGDFNSLADDSAPRFVGTGDRGLAYVSDREGAPITYVRALEPGRL